MFLLSATLLLASLASCTVSPPTVVDRRMSLQYVDDRDLDRRYEQLSVFVHAQDGDGIGDLEFLYVIHDESRLYWKLSADNWQRVEEGGSVWIGSSGLTRAEYGPVPRGRYRIIVIDRAGERDETALDLSAPRLSVDGASSSPTGASRDPAFPALTVADGQRDSQLFRISLGDADTQGTVAGAVSAEPETSVVVRLIDSRGRSIRTLRATPGTYRRRDLFESDLAPGSVRMYLELPPDNAGMPRRISGPYRP